MAITSRRAARSDARLARMLEAMVLAKVIEERKRAAELERRKEQLQRQRQADDRAVAHLMGQIDTGNTGFLNRTQVRQLLAATIGKIGTPVDEDGLDMVMTSAHQKAGTAPTLPKEHAMVPRAALNHSVHKYRYYLCNRDRVNRLFARWDFDLNNGLDATELGSLIASQEANLTASQKRANSLGLIVELRPTAADIAFIMRECDADANGLIDKSELLIALSLWAELADQKMATQSACCFS